MSDQTIGPVILIDLSYIGPSAAEIVWRSLDPELAKVTPTVTHEPAEGDGLQADNVSPALTTT